MPPWVMHCCWLTPLWQLPATQHTPPTVLLLLLPEHTPLLQLFLALKAPAHWSAGVSLHAPLAQHAACSQMSE
jgi:hypothetical protein